MMKPKIRNIINICAIICGLIILILLIYQQYFAADALYARDNLYYIKKQYQLTEDTAPKTYIDMPLYRTLEDLDKIVQYNVFATLVLQSYITQDRAEMDQQKLEVEVQDAISEIDIYNILSHMVLIANDDDIQTIYNTYQFLAASINSESFVMIKSNIDSWSEQYSQMEEQSKQALDIIKTDTYIMLFISLVMILTG